MKVPFINQIIFFATLKTLISIFVICFCGCRTGMQEVDPSKRIGESIVTAINAYHDKYEAYPKSLDSLVPEFIDEIETPTFGTKKWWYVVLENGKHFELSFEGASAISSVYIWHSNLGHWHEDTR